MALSKILENSITDGVISAAKLKDFAAAVDLNGVELILDADQDTSITADTDDQIDIKISGADDFRFTANTFTALSGSGIVVPDGGLTLGSTAISATAAEINLIDGGTSTGTTAVADADGIITNDGGTMRLTTAATFKTYFQEGISTAYDDLTTGDAAVNIATSAGNITIDAQGNDTDIIFKGTDGGADTTYMTIDGSAGGDLFLTGGLIDLKNDGSAVSQIKFYCESSNAHAQTLIGAPHSESATNTLTLPSTGGNSYLVTAASTATLTNKTLTSPVINTGTFGTSILPVSADGTTLGSASKEFSDLFLADGSTIQFGNDQDTILTHTDGAGLTLNSTNKLMFNDASQYIQGASATVLDIAATDEIELTATLIEVVGNATVSGTLGVTGVLTGTSLDISGNIDIDGTTNLDAVDIDGAVQLDATLTVGANDQGYDVILYGDTASANMTWDTSVDDLIFNGAARIVVPDGQLVLGSTAVTSTAAELNLLDGVSGLVQADLTKLAAVDATAAELNIMDGGTSATSTTIADADRFVLNDNGTMVQVAGSDVKTYIGGVSTLAGLTDVSMDITNLTNGIIIQTNRDGSAPSTGTLNNASGILGIGENVFAALTEGDDNIALGNNTLMALTTADNTVAIGSNAGTAITTGGNNTAVGVGALQANQTGHRNVALGHTALYSCTVSDNVGLGQQAGYSITTGTRNIAIGTNAYDDSDTEDDNIAIGYNAMTTNTAGGTGNVAVGNYAADALTSGDNNTAVGYGALGSNTTANSNTAVGKGAGADIVDGQTGVYIGLNTNPSAGDSNNAIVIGSDFTGSGNHFSFGKGGNVVSNQFTSNASFSRSSDLHKKTNIESTDLGLSFINELRPVTFNWKPSNEFPKHYEDYREDENLMETDINLYGMIAQEVKSALDKVGHENFGGWSEEEDGSQKLAQSMFIYPLINAIQELSAKVDAQQSEIDALKNA